MSYRIPHEFTAAGFCKMKAFPDDSGHAEAWVFVRDTRERITHAEQQDAMFID